MKQRPIDIYAPFLKVLHREEMLDFGLQVTPLVDASSLAAWLGIKRCILKLETVHPTGTFKDRITEVMYSFFKREGIQEYAHASTGNTATSLVWGRSMYQYPLRLHIFVAEEQLPFHHYDHEDRVITHLLEGASYQQTKKYASWYSKAVLGQAEEFMSFHSPVRQEGNKLPCLEALWQCKEQRIEVDAICQTISDGSGLYGASLAVSDAAKVGWIQRQRLPALCAFQPMASNPMVRCHRTGSEAYLPACTLPHLSPSKASFIRRVDAAGSYAEIQKIVSVRGGYMQDADEDQIEAAHAALREKEGIEASYTSCVALAGIKKQRQLDERLADTTALVLITGRDRQAVVSPAIDHVVRAETWQEVVR